MTLIERRWRLLFARNHSAPDAQERPERAGDSRVRMIWFGLVTLLAVFTYFYGLDSQYAPKNRDEYVYQHITRLTAASGRWLPLQSELDHMRNTKPPLLFWQGLVASDWGQRWSLWQLRFPSVIYTLLTAGMVFLLATKLSGRRETGLVALLSFLGFLSTYRYGRPFLANAPEVFWLFLPFFALLYWQPRSFASRLVFPVMLGMGIGVGLLYKSFALAAPVGFGLAWWYWHVRGYRIIEFLARDAWKIAVTIALALGIFALWFVFDPDPLAVWNEFVVGENAEKFDLQGSYVAKFLWGSDSVWLLALGYLENAGLLAFPVLALCLVCFRRRSELSEGEKLLWIWVFALFLVFSLPSQRSARYLLPAMPALAVLLALNWERISRKAFVSSLIAAAIVLATLALFAVHLRSQIADVSLYPVSFWLLLAVTSVALLVALFVPALTRPSVNAVVMLVFLSFAAFVHPFDGSVGNYSATAQDNVRGKDVWAPYDFNAKYERYRFMLPGAEIHGYRSGDATIAGLNARYPLFVIEAMPTEATCERCRTLGQRIELGVQDSAHRFPAIYAREFLIEGQKAGAGAALEAKQDPGQPKKPAHTDAR